MRTPTPPTGGTCFASPERCSDEAILAQSRRLAHEPLLAQLLECFPIPAMAVNEHRQIVLCNNILATMLDVRPEDLLGARPGEALSCVHVEGSPGGCGTTEACRYCGAVNALLRSFETNQTTSEECRITRVVDGELAALDLRVTTSPLVIGSGRYVIFAALDITDDKRRRVLERIFFHDAMNVAGGLQGLADLLLEDMGSDSHEILGEIRALTGQLVDEIRAQRDLAAAESGDLIVNVKTVAMSALLTTLASSYAHHTAALGKRIEIEELSGPVTLATDEVILRRILGNLLKNALEASSAGDVIGLSYSLEQGMATFKVRNPGVMPDRVQKQLFSRSFSTKGEPGRGIGTYSVRLLTERYLRGRVDFRSNPAEGTVFRVRLAVTPPETRP